MAGVRGKGDFAGSPIAGAIPTAEEQKTCSNNEYSKLVVVNWNSNQEKRQNLDETCQLEEIGG